MPDADATLARLRECTKKLHGREAIYSRDTLDALVDVVAYFDTLDACLTAGGPLPADWDHREP